MTSTTRSLALAAGVALALLLQGCAPTLPVAVKPVGCEVSAATLALQCAAPQAVADGITYADVLSIGREDRKALRECRAHLQLALGVLKECRGAIAAYGQEVDRVNQALGAQGR